MRREVVVALWALLIPVSASAQTTDELLNTEKTPQSVLTYGMNYNQNRFSPLSQINKDTVKRLIPAWSYSMNNNTGEESQPLVYDGVIYVTSQNKTVAVDALTGREIWNTPVEYPTATTRVVCCGIINRGAAIYEGKLFRTTLDAKVVALDMKTGKQIWSTKSGDAKDGIATNSIVALRPKTGEVVWHYQVSPTDPFDHDNITSIILADLPINGKPTKILMQAGRNGFFYVLERATGRLLEANPYVKVTWASGIDTTTGRPLWTDTTKKALTLTDEITTWPSNSGGTNWFPYSFDPRNNTAYVNTLDFGMKYQPGPIEEIRNLKPGQGHRGVKITKIYDEGVRGHLRAIDPMTGKAKWEIPFKSPNWAGTLVTAGGLVFTGMLTGEFIAVDAETGKIVWQFQTPSGIIGQPVTWEKDGKQYLTTTSGTGGVYVMNTPDPNLAHTPAGGTLWTFRLMDQ
jgi:glucose dehydrogenase